MDWVKCDMHQCPFASPEEKDAIVFAALAPLPSTAV